MKIIKRILAKDIKKGTCAGCPCVLTEYSEEIQNYGCLSDHYDIVKDYLDNNGHWKCHSKNKKCGGLQQIIDRDKLPKRNSDLLITAESELF